MAKNKQRHVRNTDKGDHMVPPTKYNLISILAHEDEEINEMPENEF